MENILKLSVDDFKSNAGDNRHAVFNLSTPDANDTSSDQLRRPLQSLP